MTGKCVPTKLYRKPALPTTPATDYVTTVTKGRRSGGCKEGLRKYQNSQTRINFTRALLLANLILVTVFLSLSNTARSFLRFRMEEWALRQGSNCKYTKQSQSNEKRRSSSFRFRKSEPPHCKQLVLYLTKCFIEDLDGIFGKFQVAPNKIQWRAFVNTAVEASVYDMNRK